MNPHFRHALVLGISVEPEMEALTAADFHSRRAEHHIEESRQETADRHRDVAETYAKSAFSFKRSREADNRGETAHAKDHGRRGKDHLRNASDLASKHGLEQPPNLNNILGVIRGEGTQIGAE